MRRSSNSSNLSAVDRMRGLPGIHHIGSSPGVKILVERGEAA
jgi:hypothetical protein